MVRALGHVAAVAVLLCSCSSSPEVASIGGERVGDLAERKITGVTLLDTPIGALLADDLGYVLYSAIGDSLSEPTCADRDCLAVWPPIFAAEELEIGPGVAGQLVEIARAKNQRVVTFNGRLLHRFGGEDGPGTYDGCGIAGRWYPVSADGDPVRDC